MSKLLESISAELYQKRIADTQTAILTVRGQVDQLVFQSIAQYWASDKDPSVLNAIDSLFTLGGNTRYQTDYRRVITLVTLARFAPQSEKNPVAGFKNSATAKTAYSKGKKGKLNGESVADMREAVNAYRSEFLTIDEDGEMAVRDWRTFGLKEAAEKAPDSPAQILTKRLVAVEKRMTKDDVDDDVLLDPKVLQAFADIEARITAAQVREAQREERRLMEELEKEISEAA